MTVRVGDGWRAFVTELGRAGVDVREDRASRAVFATDAGGLVHGLAHGVVAPRSADDVAAVLRAAQRHLVPVTVRGGGLTTEGESVAVGGCLLNMASMNRVGAVDVERRTARVEAGIYWHTLGEHLRRYGLDYVSAPLNFTSSVGGTLGVGGIDMNSCNEGCCADQAIALRVVTPTGEIVDCSERQHPELFERVLLGYGQYGVIVEATLRVRPYTPIALQYWFYSSLRTATEDLIALVRAQVADYAGILTVNDRGVTLLVAFDSEPRQRTFDETWAPGLRGRTQTAFVAAMALHFAVRPWRWREAAGMARRARGILPELHRPEHRQDGKILDRSVVFSRAVWKHWGQRRMVIPDLATSEGKIIEAVERGAAVCRRFFPVFSLYIVATRIQAGRTRYELSCIPTDAEDWAYGCSFEPRFEADEYSSDHLQRFKEAIYDVGLELGTTYYRFGGAMRGYIRRALGDAIVDKYSALKRAVDPGMILNPHVLFGPADRGEPAVEHVRRGTMQR